MAKKPLPKPAPAVPDFESALAELEALVARMESGDQTLEEALAAFQRGVELTRTCQQGLKEAEQRVEQLVRANGEVRIEPLERANGNEDDAPRN